MLEEDAGVEVDVGVDFALSDPELDFALSLDAADEDESLLPSLELDDESFDPPSDDFGAEGDFAL